MESIKKEKKFITILFLLSIVLFFWLVQSYIGVIIFSLITAFFASGVYKKILKKTKKKRIALSGTWLTIALVFIIPFSFIVTISVKQGAILANDVGNSISQQKLPENEKLSKENIQKIFAQIDDYAQEKNIDIDMEGLYQKAFSTIRSVVGNITTWLYGLALNIFGWFTALFLYVFVTSGILIHQDKLLTTLKKIVPLSERKTNRYITKISAMMNAIIKGTFVIAIIQGIITGISFAIGGVPYYAFWTLLVIFLSLIPMIGAGVIAFPIGVILLITGSIRQGVMILIVNMLIVGNIDALLRPKLVGGEAKINGTLLILSIFGGLAIFGFMGLFYGPVIMVFILTSIEYYLEEHHSTGK